MMNKTSGLGGQAPVPMKLFATWEIDRSSAICMPRVCTMTICKLKILKELDKDVQCVFIAVKMQGSKRVFRSCEIYLANNGLVDTTLELTFSLEYPHFVKRDGNKLQIMLQRKKRYKNRAMLGYKTLAVCRVDMGLLIQCPLPNESKLTLLTMQKDQDATVSAAAQIVVSSMHSLPMDADLDGERGGKQGNERSPEVDNSSEDDEETFSSEGGSDIVQEDFSRLNYIDGEQRNQKIKSRRKVRMSSSSRQQNFIKSKVAALLKKFRQVSEDDLDPTLVQDHDANPVTPDDYDFLYDELEDFNFSDSCPEIDDNISIVSTPKPKLKPFFDRISHSSSQAEIASFRDTGVNNDAEARKIPSWNEVHRSPLSDQRTTEPDTPTSGHLSAGQSYIISAASSPEIKTARSHTNSGEKRKKWSASCVDSKMPASSFCMVSVNDFLAVLESDDSLPENVFLVDGNDRLACKVGNALALPSVGLSKPVSTRSSHDVQQVFTSFFTRLQKYLNRNPLPLLPVKFAVVGSLVYLNIVLRHFAESLSSRSSDWQSLLLFYIIPTASNRVSRYLASIDPRYALSFGEVVWKESLDQIADPTTSDISTELLEIGSKLREFICDATQVLPLSICEAMMTFRQRSPEESSSQKFLPFISEVKVGENDLVNATDSDKEETAVNPPSNIPITSPGVAQSLVSPPPSPSVPPNLPSSANQAAINNVTPCQPAEVKIGLQVDYWKERDATKYTLKTNFKSFHVTCLPLLGERACTPSLYLDIVTKGKKNLMRLPGKKGKEKETDSKCQAVGNINRLICTSKHQNSLLQVTIDGVEWKDVKFFQLSAHWSSHVKTFPVAIFSL